MYVPLARRLARHGVPAMRMDLSGLGDSLPQPGYAENKPYTEAVAADVAAAMDILAEECQVEQFKLVGLCSGAYAAMQAASSERVTDLVLINQLVYFLAKDDLQKLSDGTLRSAHDLDFPRSNSRLYKATVKVLSRIPARYNWPGQWLSQFLLGGDLSSELRRLSDRGLCLAFLQSSRDDAVTALHTAAGRQVHKLVLAGQAKKVTFDRTDHTFSPRQSQKHLSDWLIDNLQCSDLKK